MACTAAHPWRGAVSADPETATIPLRHGALALGPVHHVLHIQNVLTAKSLSSQQRFGQPTRPLVDSPQRGARRGAPENNLQLSQASELSAQLQAKVKALEPQRPVFFSGPAAAHLQSRCSTTTATAPTTMANIIVDSAVMHLQGRWLLGATCLAPCF